MNSIVSVSVDDFLLGPQTYSDNKEQTWDIDPLVLSCATKELVESGRLYCSLGDREVRESVEPKHYELAEIIRKYYTKKFFWTSLAESRPLSLYRQRLCYLLETRSLTTVDRDTGIYYKIPWFYDEDMIYDDFKKTYNTTDLPNPNGGRTLYNSNKKTLKLSYLKTTVSRQQKRHLNRFWFTDNTYLYSIEIANDNPLLNLFKQLVIDQLTVSLETHYNIDRIDQMYFYKLYNFSLAKEQNA